MPKTKPAYRETKFGILSIKEIEALITDGVANVNAFLLREFENLPIGVKTAKDLHEKIAGHVFDEAGSFRKREVRVGNCEPPKFFQISSFVGIKRTDFATAMKKATTEHDVKSVIKLINKSIQ